MVKHIVMWKLADQAEGRSKEENARLIKEKLEGLNGRIPGMISLEVGIDFSKTEMSYDCVLYSEFESRVDLEAYQKNPEHVAIKPFVKSVRTDRVVTDYNTGS